MRIVYNNGNWTFNEDYKNASVRIAKECYVHDERGELEVTSRLYVDDQPIILTDPENYKSLEKVFYKIMRADADGLCAFDINRAWNEIIDQDILNGGQK